MNEMVRPPIEPPAREAAINAPLVVVILVALLFAIHGVRSFLPEETDLQVILLFSFLPARFDPVILGGARLPGGAAADVWTFVTYAFLHADWVHLSVNSVWLLAFGSPVAWRFGWARFLIFSVICTAAGAGLHLAFHWGDVAPVIGASAAISGQTAAAIRFVFQPGAPLGLFRVNGRAAFRVPALGLLEVLRDRRVLFFLVAWFVLNVVFGIGLVVMAGEDQSIAWQAHVGGFIAGLLLFPLFDPVRSPL